MSTYLYLRCDAHDPPLFSDEVGHRLAHLPGIRGYIRDREMLVAALTRGWVLDYHGENNAAQFLHLHPHCPLSIQDEYGDEHPIEEETP